MRVYRGIVIYLAAGLVLGAQAELTHRYSFDNNVNDVAGSWGSSGDPTRATLNTEPLLYTKDTPPNGAAKGPTNSLEVGMNHGTKKSGFQLDPVYVFSSGVGSYSLWFKADVMANGHYIFAAHGGPSLLGQSATKVQVVLNPTTPVLAPISSDIWHHIAVTWDNLKGIGTVYLDGDLVGASRFSAHALAPAAFRVGGFDLANDGVAKESQFAGHLYDLQFYDHILDHAEVSKLYRSPGSAIELVRGF